MSLQEVKEEVLSLAKSEALALVSDAKKEASRIAKEAEKKADELRGRLDLEAKKLSESIKKQDMASAELEARKVVLQAKKELVEESFLAARKKLESLDDKKRELLLKKMMDSAKKAIEVSHVYCNKKDAKLLKGVKIESMEISGGIICENEQKTIRVDYSYDTILQAVKEAKMQEISNILFD